MVWWSLRHVFHKNIIKHLKFEKERSVTALVTGFKCFWFWYLFKFSKYLRIEHGSMYLQYIKWGSKFDNTN